MEELISQLKKVLANTFVMYMKSHSFHWNVEGKEFVQMHNFFGDLYEELHASIDPIAENIRALDAYAPSSLSRMIELSSISDENTIPTCEMMVIHLSTANSIVIQTLTSAREVAEREKKYALVSFLETRLEIHEKHGWMLKSITKKI